VIHALRYTLIAIFTVFWGFVACVLSFVDRSGESIVWVGRRWIAWILAVCRVRVESVGGEALPELQPVVLMANHSSVFDIAAIVATVPIPFRFVAKRELTWIPFFGWALVLGGHIIVDRGRRDRAVASLERAAERVGSGINVIVFPEGTRNDGRGLRDFKSGGFHLAIQAGVPIVPVSISGSHRITPRGSLRAQSGTIHVRYGEPIPTAGVPLEKRDALKREVRQAILAGLPPEQKARDAPCG
jgi:1-acyl-sn-glycerol-3-phosphate acyltransferase